MTGVVRKGDRCPGCAVVCVSHEQAERMRSHLIRESFTCSSRNDWQEVWHDDSGRQVVLTLVDSIHDPVEAEVLDRRFRPDVRLAYNAKGLAVLLGRTVGES